MGDRLFRTFRRKAVSRKDTSFGIVPIAHRPDGNLFLLVQHNAGHWSFPKGHAEPGESAQATACREFEEETGIQGYEVLDTTFVEQYQFTKAGKLLEKTVTYFPAFVQSEVVNYQQEEIKDYAWLNYEAALAKLTFVQSQQVLMQVQTYLQEIGKKV